MEWTELTGKIEANFPDNDDQMLLYMRHLWITQNGHTTEKELSTRIRAKITAETLAVNFVRVGRRGEPRKRHPVEQRNSNHHRRVTLSITRLARGQAFAVLVPVMTAGMKGDASTHEHVVATRIIVAQPH